MDNLKLPLRKVSYVEYSREIRITHSVSMPLLLLAVSARVWRVSRKEERAEAVETSCRCRVWLLVTSSSTRGRLTCHTHIVI